MDTLTEETMSLRNVSVLTAFARSPAYTPMLQFTTMVPEVWICSRSRKLPHIRGTLHMSPSC